MYIETLMNFIFQFHFSENVCKPVCSVHSGEVFAPEDIHNFPYPGPAALDGGRLPELREGSHHKEGPDGILHGREAGGKNEKEANLGVG